MKTFNSLQVEYNIAKANGEVMLGVWVDRNTAYKYLNEHYLAKYKPGSPYPNGKGYYPDFGFHVIHRVVGD